MDALNMVDQVNRAIEKGPKTKSEDTKELLLENCLVIVDEAHNLFNSITNGSKNATLLYDKIMKTKNVKLLFLTGTPIVNEPFELVSCFNMLSGERILPEVYDDFKSYFTKNNHIKNKYVFQDRLMGLVSYYGTIYKQGLPDLTKPIKRDGFPTQLPIIVERIPMSEYQYGKYALYRDREREENSKKSVASEGIFKSKSQSSTSYRTGSRQLSNARIPEYVIDEDGEKHMDKIKKEDLKSFTKYSTKIPRALEIMNKTTKEKYGLGYFYSGFVKAEGLKIMELVMIADGWIKIPIDEIKSIDDKNKNNKINELVKRYKDKRTFISITGEIGDVLVRDKIQEVWNNIANIDGSIINWLLISSIAKEGFSLNNTRYCIILEPYWNYGRILQVVGRGVRWMSAKDLPEKERTFQPYLLLSDYPKELGDDEKPKVSRKIDGRIVQVQELTTDVHMYRKALKQYYLNMEFYIALIEIAIECPIFNKQDNIICRTCEPTGKKLFGQIEEDIMSPSRCKKITKETIDVKEYIVNYNDKDYKIYVDKNDETSLFIYDEKINAYKSINPNSELYTFAYNSINNTFN